MTDAGRMTDAERAWQFLEDSDPIASAEEVQAAVHRVAGQILPLLRFPMDFDYIHASRYGAQTRGNDVDWRVKPPASVRGRAVLVLDDILDGGQTMDAIREQLLGLGATSFHCAVLVEKKLKVGKPIHADFVGLQIEDCFVFGYGMDAKGYWRNLPEIRAMRGT